ncbi:MAG: hypothetical protein D6814_08810 [Calditrichaeota bacterium]|nr:MAG: hypothetical protein D6814_08810 [Calditrichota bacterium]
MNYPVWEVSFGAGLLIAIVAITHVFVSHFAVGGGLFLVLTELKAYREKDQALLAWLKSHTKFFVLVTIVFGAVSGVGIWFTIGLIHPSGTSTLIHSFVWGWAIEWVFFFLEISSALMYLYGWDKLNQKTHLWYGWIYFGAAFLSMVIINGIVTFMLTSGHWIRTHNFWQGFFNPTYFPSLGFRFFLSLALAGVYALLTGTRQANLDLRGKLVKWSALWILPSFVVLSLFGWWYIQQVPATAWLMTRGRMPTATTYATSLWIFGGITFILSLLTLLRPKKIPFVYAVVVFVTAFATMGSFEFIREAIRKPYIIYRYMYVNSIYRLPVKGDSGMNVHNINKQGVLQVARWVDRRNLQDGNQAAMGREVFRVECRSCHTIDGYRGLQPILRQKGWNYETILAMLGSLQYMHNGAMPPFAGVEAEKEALARYLETLVPAGKRAAVSARPSDGAAVFETYCQPCHLVKPDDPLFTKFRGISQPQMAYLITRLDSLNNKMPDLRLQPAQTTVLAKWIASQYK